MFAKLCGKISPQRCIPSTPKRLCSLRQNVYFLMDIAVPWRKVRKGLKKWKNVQKAGAEMSKI
jgi:hypothetical protein